MSAKVLLCLLLALMGVVGCAATCTRDSGLEIWVYDGGAGWCLSDDGTMYEVGPLFDALTARLEQLEAPSRVTLKLLYVMRLTDEWGRVLSGLVAVARKFDARVEVMYLKGSYSGWVSDPHGVLEVEK